MAYRLLLTEVYKAHYHSSIDYILNELKNRQAAERLMDEIDKYYLLIAENPYLFSISHDRFLHARAFRQVPVSGYIITYRVDEDTKEVHLMGFQYQRQEPVKGLF